MKKNEAKGADYLERLWDAIFDLAERRKVGPMKDRIWVANIGGENAIVMNGTKTVHKHLGWKIEPLHCAVWFNGWLVGDFSPFEGTIVANTIESAEPLIEAIKRAA